MAQADLECYDENGQVTLNAATLFGRVLGTFSTGTSDGSRYFAGLTTSGADFWYMSSPVGNDSIRVTPRFSIANDTISWTFTDVFVGNGNAPRIGLTVIVGTD